MGAILGNNSSGVITSKEVEGVRFKNVLTYTRYSSVADEKQKKVLGVFISNFETYLRIFFSCRWKAKKSLRCIH